MKTVDIVRTTAPVVNVPVGPGTIIGLAAAAAAALIGSKIIGSGVKVIMTPSTETDPDDEVDISSKE